MNDILLDEVKKLVGSAQFVMLRYETEFTPCTGITAVTRQERRHFKQGVILAPWCPHLRREKPQDDPLLSGKVQATGWAFNVFGRRGEVLVSRDGLAPVVLLKVEGRFQGIETPYDVPLPELREDTLYFGLAVTWLLTEVGSVQQFIWGADWESVPALYLLRPDHPIALTLHNTFDECLENEVDTFGNIFRAFKARNAADTGAKTALQIGLEIADVVTTVNRGFAYGMRNEPIQRVVMANHLQPLLSKVIGIDNGPFTTLSPELIALKDRLQTNFTVGAADLLSLKTVARTQLPVDIQEMAAGKVIVVSMGRRVAQKQHDLLVESARQILTQDPSFPLLVIFSTMHGDLGSPARFERMKMLQRSFPGNVVVTDGRLSYYAALMAAADFNAMPSLYEPHGGAFEGTVVPIARAIDGLAEQICALRPVGQAAKINALWHSKDESPSGLLFREAESRDQAQLESDLHELLSVSPSPDNQAFKDMCAALTATLLEAVELRQHQPETYARLVLAALAKQEGWSWQQNLQAMLDLITAARLKRPIAALRRSAVIDPKSASTR